MPDSGPCFCSFNTDAIEFDLPSLWKGTVKVVYGGNHVKHVEVNRDGAVEGQYAYCDNPNPAPHNIAINPTPSPLPYRIVPFHSVDLCGNKIYGDTHVTAATRDFCSDTGTQRKARFTIPIDTTDTVQIVIEIVNTAGGGDTLTSDSVALSPEVLSLSDRVKALLKRMASRVRGSK